MPKSAPLPLVDIVYGYAGASAAIIDALVARKVDGIVYAGVGSGNFDGEVGRALDRARAKGVIVVRSSRVGSGNVARNAEISDDAHDFVVADNLNPQKARVLLMLGLIRSRNTAELQRFFFEH